MSQFVKVQTSVGEWELNKPKAGTRNRALIKAETSSGELKLIETEKVLASLIRKLH